MQRRTKATLTLLFLSPLLAELVSGSMPPIEWLGVGGPLLLMLYGCGALLIRDAAIRWNKGWLSILLLGCAYGVFEEGIVVKSWFDPVWMDLGYQATYGRVAGVNWVWAANLTLYHAVVSIALPIFLLNVLFPDLKGQRLLSTRGTRLALTAEAGVFVVGSIGWGYWGGAEHSLAFAATFAFAYAAWRAPADFLTPLAAVAPRRAWAFAVVGAAWMGWNFFFPAAAAAVGVPFPLTILVVTATAILMLLALRGLLHPSNAERFLFAFLAGAFSFIIFFGLLYELGNPVLGFGMFAVGPAAAWFFRSTYRKNLARWSAAPSGAPAAPAPGAQRA